MDLLPGKTDLFTLRREDDGRSGYSPTHEFKKSQGKKICCLLLTLFCAFLIAYQLSAQEKLLPVFHFDRVTTEDGLPDDAIRSNVVRDHEGFIWIPTINGLARYDGYTCKVYRKRIGDANSISSNMLMCIYIDKINRLWIGTWDAGLTMYDPSLDKFINIYPRKNDSTWLSFNTVFFIRQDKSGNAWLMGLEGEVANVNMSELVEVADPDSILNKIRFRIYRPDPIRKRIWDIEAWEQNNAIVSTGIGLFIIDPVSEKISTPKLVAMDGYRLDTVSNVTLYRENNSVLWMGTHKHDIFRYDEKNRILKHYPPRARDGQKLHTDIQYIQMDGFGNLWIGTDSGFEVFDTTSCMFIDYLYSSSTGPTHEGLTTKKMYLDNTGTFWVSASKSGIYFMRKESQLFRHFGLRDTARKALSMGSIVRWKDGSLWVGASGKIVNIDPVTLEVLRSIDVLKGKKAAWVYPAEFGAYTDRNNFIWYGVWGLGLYRIDPSTGSVTNYRVSDQIPSKRNIYWNIDGNGGDTIWIAGNTDGLLLFNSRTGKYMLPKDTVLSKLLNVAHVMCDRNGIFWISDEQSGLFRVKSSGEVIDRYEPNVFDSTSLAVAKVRDVYEDARGRIWIGGMSIDLWRPETRSFVHFYNELFEETGLVIPILCDFHGSLWVRTPGVGLHMLDPATGIYSNYLSTDGLGGAGIGTSLMEDGRMFFVGGPGLNIIHPDSLDIKFQIPPLVLSKLTVNDSIKISSQIIGKTMSLDLPYDQNVLEMEFAAIDPGVTRWIKYNYRLDGLEENWIDPGDRRYVRYTGLTPGDYIFKVKAINKLKRWPDQELALSISIAPPYWKTWWAYTVYGFLLIGLLVGGYRLRLRQIYLKQNADMAHFQADRLAEVDRLKSRFFANISHEFRTPLTLLLGPADQALEEKDIETIKQKIRLMQGNAAKLLGLVNQLLDFSKIESGAMKLQVSSGEIVGFLRRIIMSFESWAERKKIDLQFNSEMEMVEGFFDGEKLEKVMNNLLSNALKFTPEAGKVEITLSLSGFNHGIPLPLREMDYGVRITVADTGPGISTEHLPNIFNRFYRADNSHHVEGTGIGLALVYELTNLHRGTVKAESELGKGSKFTVILPIDRAAYSPEEIYVTPPEVETREKPWIVESGIISPSSTEVVSAEGKPIVLVVEDNMDLRVYIREFLDRDYTVHEAGNGKEGLERATDVIPDIVISDVMMPEMDGIELCRALKKDVRTSHVPVILLTARAGTDSKIEGLETGADDYITKPFDSRELAVRVKNLIEQRRQLRTKFSSGVVLKPGEVAVTSLDDVLLKKIMDAIEKHMGDEKFGVDELAKEACFSRRHLNRKLTGLTNLSPAEFIQYIRLQRAHELLSKNTGSISDIAYRVGFGSPSYFTACFHERYGYPPSALQDKQ